MLKKYLINTPFHRMYKEIEAFLLHFLVKIIKESHKKKYYIVSPYRTGTTYLASLWNKDIARHEPAHMYTLKYFVKSNISKTFLKRSALLDIKIEASGAFSLILDKLEKLDEAEYIYILRPPSDWIKSVINHFIYL
jgi:hypothetical protein